MKRVLAILFIIVGLSANGQTIEDFYQPGSTWTSIAYNYHKTGSGTAWEWGAEGIVYKIEKETIASGIKYYQLSVGSKAGYHFFEDAYGNTTFSTWPELSPSNILGRIRIDNSKVYFTFDDPGW